MTLILMVATVAVLVFLGLSCRRARPPWGSVRTGWSWCRPIPS